MRPEELKVNSEVSWRISRLREAKVGFLEDQIRSVTHWTSAKPLNVWFSRFVRMVRS